MKLDGLIPLYKSMIDQQANRCKFDFTFKGIKFDVLYFIDESPHKLAFGVVKENYYFETVVYNGFNVKAFIPEMSRLIKILGLEYDRENPFHPSDFFNYFNQSIPKHFKGSSNVPLPKDIAPFRPDVEEADKIYFKGWQDNTKAGKNVRPGNLEKTKKWLTLEAHELCKRKNISSCWSANPKEEKQIILPK